MPKSVASKKSTKRHLRLLLSTNPGFTIVELLVVIVVIGILAAITIVSYTGMSGKAVTASLQSDLNNASTQLKMYQVDNGYYPTSIAIGGDYCPTPADAGAKYCLKASSNNSYTAYSAVNNTSPQTFSLTVRNTNSTVYTVTNDTAPFPTPPDTTAPAQVTGLAATNGNTQSVLTWNAATDNVGVTAYRVKRATDNTMTTNLTILTDTITTATYTATGLTNGTTYYFTIEAVDAAGNWGAASGVGSAVPAPAVDTFYAPNGSDAVGAQTYTGVLEATATVGYHRGVGFYKGAYILFRNVTIRQGETITAASFRPMPDSPGYSYVNINAKLCAWDVDNGSMPTSYSDAWTTKWAERTTAVVSTSSMSNWYQNQRFMNLPSVSAVIQEIVNRAGWVSGNNILLMWVNNDNSNSDFINIQDGDWGADRTPQLVITH